MKRHQLEWLVMCALLMFFFTMTFLLINSITARFIMYVLAACYVAFGITDDLTGIKRKR